MATGDWHRAEIKLEWIRLRGKIRAYLAYLWSDLTKGVKRVKVDTEFMEKLDYWRTHRGLTVVTGRYDGFYGVYGRWQKIFIQEKVPSGVKCAWFSGGWKRYAGTLEVRRTLG